VPEAGFDETFVIQDADSTRQQTWQYPARTECAICHTPIAGHALSFNTLQLNRQTGLDGLLTNLFATITSTSEGQLRLDLRGSPDVPIQLQSSPDLQEWTPKPTSCSMPKAPTSSTSRPPAPPADTTDSSLTQPNPDLSIPAQSSRQICVRSH